MTDIIASANLEPDDLMNLGFLASNLIGGEKGHEIAALADRMACLWRIDRGQARGYRTEVAAHEKTKQLLIAAVRLSEELQP